MPRQKSHPIKHHLPTPWYVAVTHSLDMILLLTRDFMGPIGGEVSRLALPPYT